MVGCAKVGGADAGWTLIPQGVDIYIATEAVDLRYGAERLGGLVREWMGREPRSRGLFVFVGKRGTALKMLTSDSTGQILISKRLDRGTFERAVGMGVDANGMTKVRQVSEAMFATWFCGTQRTRRKTTAQMH